MTCDVCGQPLDPDIAHTPHRDGCDHHDCPCDTVRSEAADRLVDDLEHAGRALRNIVTGEHAAIPQDAA